MDQLFQAMVIFHRHISLIFNLLNRQTFFFYFQKEESNAFKSLGTGNRIATFLFYVSIFPVIVINKRRSQRKHTHM
jgi:hypothetical protein